MCRTPASILPSAALGPLRTWRGLCFASFKRCAGSSVVRPCLSPVGRAPTLCASVASSVLGAPASIRGRNSHAMGLRPFSLPCPNTLSPLAHARVTASQNSLFASERCNAWLWPRTQVVEGELQGHPLAGVGLSSLEVQHTLQVTAAQTQVCARPRHRGRGSSPHKCHGQIPRAPSPQELHRRLALSSSP